MGDNGYPTTETTVSTPGTMSSISSLSSPPSSGSFDSDSDQPAIRPRLRLHARAPRAVPKQQQPQSKSDYLKERDNAYCRQLGVTRRRLEFDTAGLVSPLGMGLVSASMLVGGYFIYRLSKWCRKTRREPEPLSEIVTE